MNLIKAAKQKYFTSVIENAKGNTKMMWNCIRELTGNCSISNKVNMLIIEGEQVCGNQNIADSFGEHFANVAKNIIS